MSIPVSSPDGPRPHAAVIVLGDLGRSPRMLNHARALLARGWRVTLLGHAENSLPPDLAARDGLGVVDLRAGGAGRLRSWCRLAAWLRRERTWRLAVVQNPPGFPVLWALPPRRPGRAVALDWHNTGDSMYALTRPHATWRRALYAACERRAARRADIHWAVSAALAGRVAPAAIVLHDAPSRVFCAAARPPPERLAWWRRALPDQPPPPADAVWLVAPSSWSADEDHDAMLRVARHWSARAGDWGAGRRPVALLASGRGPGRAAFAAAAARLPAGPVSVHPLWVEAADYPRLLAAADAGLCLHRSSSGLDLPMKLADLRGAGRHAFVLDYGPVLRELVANDPAVTFFSDDASLAARLHQLGALAPAPAAPARIWEDAWEHALGRWCSDLATRTETA